MTYLYTLVSLAILDATWLFLMGSTYQEWFAPLFTPTIQLIPVFIFYPLYAFVVYFLVVRTAISMKKSWKYVLLSGALLGLASYGAYDLTNQATIQGWSWTITLVDMLWGTCLTALASVIAWKLSKK